MTYKKLKLISMMGLVALIRLALHLRRHVGVELLTRIRMGIFGCLMGILDAIIVI
tara:strand:- start:1257 stop:1421 length:165 start_codon:yes stop_codon:yes gene_type:complete